METYEEEYTKSDKIHYQKINIFGDEGVGKTSLISYLENFESFELKEDSMSNNSRRSSIVNNSPIVEMIKKIDVKYQDFDLHLNICETNTNRYNPIQMNLDTLLVQTELILIMWDKSDLNTFDNAYKLVEAIESGIKNNQFINVSIILIQNKTDGRDSRASRSDEEILKKIETLKKEYSNISDKQMSLLNKNEDEYLELLLDIKRKSVGNDNNINNDIIDIVKFKYPLNKKKQSDSNYKTIYITLLGSAATGKTSFIRKLEDKTIDNVPPTLEAGISFQILSEIYKEKIKIILLDTAGQEKYRSLAQTSYKKADGFLIFFDVTNKDSFNEVNYYFDEIKNNKDTKAIILIGNKIDDNEKRTISKQKAKEKAEEKGIKYFEISCLYGLNVLEILNEIVLISYKSNKLKNENNQKDNDNNYNKNNSNNNNNANKKYNTYNDNENNNINNPNNKYNNIKVNENNNIYNENKNNNNMNKGINNNKYPNFDNNNMNNLNDKYPDLDNNNMINLDNKYFYNNKRKNNSLNSNSYIKKEKEEKKCFC